MSAAVLIPLCIAIAGALIYVAYLQGRSAGSKLCRDAKCSGWLWAKDFHRLRSLDRGEVTDEQMELLAKQGADLLREKKT